MSDGSSNNTSSSSPVETAIAEINTQLSISIPEMNPQERLRVISELLLSTLSSALDSPPPHSWESFYSTFRDRLSDIARQLRDLNASSTRESGSEDAVRTASYLQRSRELPQGSDADSPGPAEYEEAAQSPFTPQMDLEGLVTSSAANDASSENHTPSSQGGGCPVPQSDMSPTPSLSRCPSPAQSEASPNTSANR